VTGAPVDLGIPGLDQAVEIGRGGFAVVYRAVQATFRRTVAVKVLSRRTADPASYERFIRECEAMGLLSDHPNIVTVFDAGTTSMGNPYIVMAFVPGGSLQDRLDAQGPFTWQAALPLGVKVASALASAHRLGRPRAASSRPASPTPRPRCSPVTGRR
jgi:serine/threonine protein kinase